MKQMWANIEAIIMAKIRFMVAQSLLKNDETFASLHLKNLAQHAQLVLQ